MLRCLYKKSDVFHYTGVVMETLRMGVTAVAMLVGLSLRRQSMWYISRRWPHSSLLCYYRKKLWPCVVVVGQYRKVDPSFSLWLETTENLNKKHLPSCCMYYIYAILHIYLYYSRLYLNIVKILHIVTVEFALDLDSVCAINHLKMATSGNKVTQ
jgi:hypothetical protein